MINYTTTNVLDWNLLNEHDVFIHSQNCQNTWGAGFAVQAKKTFPELYQADMATLKGSKSKLGDFTKSDIQRLGFRIIGVNIYGQYNYGPKEFSAKDEAETRKIRYAAIREALTKVHAAYGDVKYLMPRIGAGLAGGDWKVIEGIINEVMPNASVTVSTFIPPSLKKKLDHGKKK